MTEFIRNHPIVGIISSIGSFLGSLKLTDITEILSVLSILVGLGIAILTFVIKYIELKKLMKNNE